MRSIFAKRVVPRKSTFLSENNLFQKSPRSVWEWSGGVPDLPGPVFKQFSLKSIEVPIIDMETMSKSNIRKLDIEIQRTISEDKPEAIILTSAGISDLTKTFSEKYNLPFIEGISAATALTQQLTNLGIKIKKFENKPGRNFGIPI